MTAEIFYLIGTIAFWIGLVFLGSGVVQTVRELLNPPGLRKWRGAVLALCVGAALTAVSRLMNLELGRPVTGPHIPVVWIYMVFPGWMAFGGAVFALISGSRAYTAVSEKERNRHLIAIGSWILVAIVGLTLMIRGGDRVWIFRGYLPIQFEAILAFVILAGAALGLMVLVERFASAKGFTKTLGATLALLTGTVVFGAPLVWQLIASVKEEADQSTAKGFVWLPRVQETIPFMDQKTPLLEASFEGQSVQAKLDSDLGDGKVLLEIERPFSLRGRRFETEKSATRAIPRQAKIFSKTLDGVKVTAFVVEEKENGVKKLRVLTPEAQKGKEFEEKTEKLEPVRRLGLRLENYTEALEWLPNETRNGLVYLNNTLILVVLNVLGTLLSCATVGYGFARLRFPGKDLWFTVMLSTMMLPGAVTMMPQFLIFSSLGWIDTLHPLWVPSLFAGAFNVFLIRQFFSTVPVELEEAARIDGCGYWKTFWQIMLPQIKPALAAIGVWTFMGTWNNFMGPLIYISSPEKMPLVYALAMFRGDRGGDIGLLMAFSTMAMLPVLLLFFVSQKFFIEGVQLSGLGGR